MWPLTSNINMKWMGLRQEVFIKKQKNNVYIYTVYNRRRHQWIQLGYKSRVIKITVLTHQNTKAKCQWF